VDTFKTVYSDLSGVEILATGLANLVTIRHCGRPQQSTYLSFLWLVLSWAASLRRRPASELSRGCHHFARRNLRLGYVLFVSANFVIPVVSPSAELVIGFVVTAALITSAEQKLRLSLERAAGQWLPPEVMEFVLQRGISSTAVSSGETHFAICVATDVQGFTPIAEKAFSQGTERFDAGLFRAVFRCGSQI